jgi:hypothetical protein
MKEGSAGNNGSGGGVKILVVHGKGDCSLGLRANGFLTCMPPSPEISQVIRTKR